jgi:hypothetical protein
MRNAKELSLHLFLHALIRARINEYSVHTTVCLATVFPLRPHTRLSLVAAITV